MKRLLLFGMLFLGVFSLVQAQRNTGDRPSRSGGDRPQGVRMTPEERIEREVKQLKDTLVLTDEQVVKVKAILVKNQEKRQAAFQKAREAGGEPDREAMRKEMTAAMEAQNAEIKAVLTTAQKAKYDKFQKARMERMSERLGGRPGGGQRSRTQ